MRLESVKQMTYVVSSSFLQRDSMTRNINIFLNDFTK
jgi:hypothetical protein